MYALYKVSSMSIFHCSYHQGLFIERGIIMNMDFYPIDSLVKKVVGNIRFLSSLLIPAGVFLGVLGMVGLFFGIAHFLK
jgi:hypothetical protein